MGQYYAHPRNAFWTIMGEIFGAQPELPYPDRIAVLLDSGLALWDVLQACERENSLDQAIQNELPNDLPGLLLDYPGLHTLIFNGNKAWQAFQRWTLPAIPADQQKRLSLQPLPSTSPANARLNCQQKLVQWRILRERTAA